MVFSTRITSYSYYAISYEKEEYLDFKHNKTIGKLQDVYINTKVK